MTVRDTSFINESGKEFGLLTVVARVKRLTEMGGGAGYYWACHCTCGNYILTTGTDLRSGRVQHCGCVDGHLPSSRYWLHGDFLTRTRAIRVDESGPIRSGRTVPLTTLIKENGSVPVPAQVVEPEPVQHKMELPMPVRVPVPAPIAAKLAVTHDVILSLTLILRVDTNGGVQIASVSTALRE